MQCGDIAMKPGYPLEDGNLIPDLRTNGSVVCAEADVLEKMNLPRMIRSA